MAGAILAGLLQPEVPSTAESAPPTAPPRRPPSSPGDGVTAYATEADPGEPQAVAARSRAGRCEARDGARPAREIADALEPGTLVVQVAAGVTIATFESLCPSVAVFRSMPNTPAVVGRGVTGLSAGTRSSADDLALAVRALRDRGAVIEVPEAQIDALSTISGSGPAYVFYLIEQLTATAVDKGFTPSRRRSWCRDVPRCERAARGFR